MSVTLLVISESGDQKRWEALFAGVDNVEVVCAAWQEIRLVSYPDKTGLKISITSEAQKRVFQVTPDLVLIRSMARGICLTNSRASDQRNVLYGIAHGGVPCINSALSEIAMLERPVVHGLLKGIEKRLGKEAFNVVDQIFCSSHEAQAIGPPFPCIVKVGHVHAGFGKVKVDNHHAMEELLSLLALHGDYFSIEPFIPHTRELRIQKIGDRYRAFQRIGLCGWKSNSGMGSCALEDVPLNAKWKRWVDECSVLLGGLDVLAVDAIINEETGEEVIIEMNPGAIGFHPDHVTEDEIALREVILRQISQLQGDQAATRPQSTQDESVELANLRNDFSELQVRLADAEAERLRLMRIVKTLQARVRRRVLRYVAPVVIAFLAYAARNHFSNWL